MPATVTTAVNTRSHVGRSGIVTIQIQNPMVPIVHITSANFFIRVRADALPMLTSRRHAMRSVRNPPCRLTSRQPRHEHAIPQLRHQLDAAAPSSPKTCRQLSYRSCSLDSTDSPSQILSRFRLRRPTTQRLITIRSPNRRSPSAIIQLSSHPAASKMPPIGPPTLLVCCGRQRL
jgi:hypothetical protein